MDVLEQLDAPTLIHCKSGPDRTGFVSAIYLSHIANKPVGEARKMLSIRFVNLNFTKTSIPDYVIDMFTGRFAQGQISFKDWIVNEYDPKVARAKFDALGFWQRVKL